MKCLMKAGYLRSVYESMFIDKANMIDLLINISIPYCLNLMMRKGKQ